MTYLRLCATTGCAWLVACSSSSAPDGDGGAPYDATSADAQGDARTDALATDAAPDTFATDAALDARGDVGADGVGSFDGSTSRDGAAFILPPILGCLQTGETPCDAGCGSCPGLCGNGRIDSCQEGSLYGPVSEECDGIPPAGQTCASQGYASGTLACVNCSVDSTGCGACAAGPRTVACGRSSLQGATLDFGPALAATATELAVVWMEANPGIQLHFTRLSPDLSVISDTCLMGLTSPDDYAPGLKRFSAAASTSGWLIAIPHEDGLTVASVDPAGTLKSRRTTPFSATYVGIDHMAVLVARPDGNPLLAWVDSGDGGPSGTLFADVLAADGSVLTQLVGDSAMHGNGPSSCPRTSIM